MAFDRVDWHSGSGNFPADLPYEAGGTHIGLFLAWIIQNDLYGEFHQAESPDAIAAVKRREMTGRQFLERMCDEKFWSEDLNETGNAFARWYYGGDTNQGDQPGQIGLFSTDYANILARGLPTEYHVPDTWESYDKIAPVISRRFAEWRHRNRRPWWKFW